MEGAGDDAGGGIVVDGVGFAGEGRVGAGFERVAGYPDRCDDRDGVCAGGGGDRGDFGGGGEGGVVLSAGSFVAGV